MRPQAPLDLPAQEDPLLRRPPPRFTDQVASPTVRTVQLYKQGSPSHSPSQTAADRLELHFDDLGPGRVPELHPGALRCGLATERCRKDNTWKVRSPTILLPASASNTLQPYFHYALEVPNDRMRPTRSGNYL